MIHMYPLFTLLLKARELKTAWSAHKRNPQILSCSIGVRAPSGGRILHKHFLQAKIQLDKVAPLQNWSKKWVPWNLINSLH